MGYEMVSPGFQKMFIEFYKKSLEVKEMRDMFSFENIFIKLH